MTDRNALPDPNETPEDVATLYSWANLHGAKYRDFSASRAQTREKARLRVQGAIEEERRRALQDAEAQRIAQSQRAAGAAREEEEARKAELIERQRAEQAAQYVARQAVQSATQQRTWEQQRPERVSVPPSFVSPAPNCVPKVPSYAPQAADFVPPAPGNGAPAPSYALPVQGYDPHAPRFVSPIAPPTPPSAPDYPVPQEEVPAYAAPERYRSVAGQPQHAPAGEEHYGPERNHWAPVEPKESTGRPAWLGAENAGRSSQPIPHAPEGTLQGSRDRLTSRWFALKGVFESATARVEDPAPVAARAPVLAVFSLAGGVGKTSLVATLGRALSSRGERVLLVDTAAYGLLPFFFGARDQRPGMLRTFSPPGISGDAPIQLVTMDPETMGPEDAAQETLTQEIAKASRGVSRVIVDLATASGATTRRVMRMAPTILVPVLPDMSSVVSVSSIDAFFQRNTAPGGKQVLPSYVLNRFDPSLPLHLDVREVLREQLGDRLLPFALRRTPAVSEALAEGMTVMDYAPNSTAAEDFASLAGWVKSLAAPASNGYRGVRWSER